MEADWLRRFKNASYLIDEVPIEVTEKDSLGE
jgi:hypothetical protein